MASTLPQTTDCCSPCDEAATVLVPGSQGDAGADGADGTDGVNAYTTTTALFVMPDTADGVGGIGTSNVSVSVANSTWMTVGQVVYVQNAGWMQVVSKASSVEVTLTNLEDTSTAEYDENVAPTTNIASGSYISPGGLQGPDGTAAAGVLLAANDLSDVNDAPTSRTNLGLGTAAVEDAGTANGELPAVDDAGGLTNGEAVFATAAGVESLTAANARTALGLGSLATASTVNNGDWSGTDLAVTNGGTGASTAAAARVNLDVLAGYGILGSSDAVDLNSATTDTAITMLSARYRIDKVMLENPSAAATTATAGCFTAAGGGGTTLAADQALSGTLTATTKFMDLVLQAICTTDHRTEGTLYFRCGTAEGGALTANVKIIGWKLD